MKKFISLTAVLILLLTVFPACSDRAFTESYPVTVNSTPVEGSIFRYYLDSIKKDGVLNSKEEIITEATHRCIRYIAVNSTFVSCGLTLTPAERAELSNKVNVLWNMFGEHYKSIGVEKESYLKILTSEQYIEKLRIYLYDKGGKNEISEDMLKSHLFDNYVAFRFIKTPLKDRDVYGNTVDFSEEDLEKMKSLYSDSLSEVSAAVQTEVAYGNIIKEFPLTEQSYENIVIDAKDPEYSVGFFESVKEMDENTASVFQYNDSLYMVYRTDIFSDPSIYEKYRSECLKSLSEQPLQSEITLMCNEYKSTRDPSLVNEYYNKVWR